MIFGKLIGGLVGLSVGGVPGLIIGIAVGHMFDRGLKRALQFGSAENLEQVKTSFFETTFLLSGYLAKSDGRVSREEIEHTEQVIAQMGLGADQRRRAIDLFHQGAAADFQVGPAVADFLRVCGPRRQLQQTLLLFLISLALADGQLAPGEQNALTQVGSAMGISAAQIEQLLRMVRAQQHFQGGHTAGTTTRSDLEDAYTALGVSEDISDRELKRAYRKLMSANHPDKLIAKGVPEDMIRLATERAQEIQAAYELVKRSRAK